MRRTSLITLVFTFFCTFSLLFAAGGHDHPPVTGHDHDHDHGQKGPLKFVQNKTQWEPEVRFRVDILGGQAFLLDQKFVFVYQHPEDMQTLDRLFHDFDPVVRHSAETMMVRQHAYSVEFSNSLTPNVFGTEKMTAYHNYFLGNDPAKWSSNVPLFETVEYQGLYPGIDLRVYSQELNFKYDFILQPNADPALIQMKYQDLESVSIQEGNLILKTSVNEVIEQKPFAYQMINGQQVEVHCEAVLKGDEVSFRFPKGYDRSRELVIDPVVVASTHSGSTATIYGHTATYDQGGNCFVGGAGFAPGGLPLTQGAFQSTYGVAGMPVSINTILPAPV